MDIVALWTAVYHRLVNDKRPTIGKNLFVFVKGWQVQGNYQWRILYQRRADLVVCNHNSAIRRPAAHFGAVGRDPGHFLAHVHRGISNDLPGKEHALSAKP